MPNHKQQPYNRGIHTNIILTSVMVDKQGKALKFYTEVLGFIRKKDIPTGEYKWPTIVSPGNKKGVELLLEHHKRQTFTQNEKDIINSFSYYSILSFRFRI